MFPNPSRGNQPNVATHGTATHGVNRTNAASSRTSSTTSSRSGSVATGTSTTQLTLPSVVASNQTAAVQKQPVLVSKASSKREALAKQSMNDDISVSSSIRSVSFSVDGNNNGETKAVSAVPTSSSLSAVKVNNSSSSIGSTGSSLNDEQQQEYYKKYFIYREQHRHRLESLMKQTRRMMANATSYEGAAINTMSTSVHSKSGSKTTASASVSLSKSKKLPLPCLSPTSHARQMMMNASVGSVCSSKEDTTIGDDNNSISSSITSNAKSYTSGSIKYNLKNYIRVPTTTTTASTAITKQVTTGTQFKLNVDDSRDDYYNDHYCSNNTNNINKTSFSSTAKNHVLSYENDSRNQYRLNMFRSKPTPPSIHVPTLTSPSPSVSVRVSPNASVCSTRSIKTPIVVQQQHYQYQQPVKVLQPEVVAKAAAAIPKVASTVRSTTTAREIEVPALFPDPAQTPTPAPAVAPESVVSAPAPAPAPIAPASPVPALVPVSVPRGTDPPESFGGPQLRYVVSDDEEYDDEEYTKINSQSYENYYSADADDIDIKTVIDDDAAAPIVKKIDAKVVDDDDDVVPLVNDPVEEDDDKLLALSNHYQLSTTSSGYKISDHDQVVDEKAIIPKLVDEEVTVRGQDEEAVDNDQSFLVNSNHGQWKWEVDSDEEASFSVMEQQSFADTEVLQIYEGNDNETNGTSTRSFVTNKLDPPQVLNDNESIVVVESSSSNIQESVCQYEEKEEFEQKTEETDLIHDAAAIEVCLYEEKEEFEQKTEEQTVEVEAPVLLAVEEVAIAIDEPVVEGEESVLQVEVLKVENDESIVAAEEAVLQVEELVVEKDIPVEDGAKPVLQVKNDEPVVDAEDLTQIPEILDPAVPMVLSSEEEIENRMYGLTLVATVETSTTGKEGAIEVNTLTSNTHKVSSSIEWPEDEKANIKGTGMGVDEVEPYMECIEVRGSTSFSFYDPNIFKKESASQQSKITKEIDTSQMAEATKDSLINEEVITEVVEEQPSPANVTAKETEIVSHPTLQHETVDAPYEEETPIGTVEMTDEAIEVTLLDMQEMYDDASEEMSAVESNVECEEVPSGLHDEPMAETEHVNVGTSTTFSFYQPTKFEADDHTTNNQTDLTIVTVDKSIASTPDYTIIANRNTNVFSFYCPTGVEPSHTTLEVDTTPIVDNFEQSRETPVNEKITLEDSPVTTDATMPAETIGCPIPTEAVDNITTTVEAEENTSIATEVKEDNRTSDVIGEFSLTATEADDAVPIAILAVEENSTSMEVQCNADVSNAIGTIDACLILLEPMDVDETSPADDESGSTKLYSFYTPEACVTVESANTDVQEKSIKDEGNSMELSNGVSTSGNINNATTSPEESIGEEVKEKVELTVPTTKDNMKVGIVKSISDGHPDVPELDTNAEETSRAVYEIQSPMKDAVTDPKPCLDGLYPISSTPEFQLENEEVKFLNEVNPDDHAAPLSTSQFQPVKTETAVIEDVKSDDRGVVTEILSIKNAADSKIVENTADSKVADEKAISSKYGDQGDHVVVNRPVSNVNFDESNFFPKVWSFHSVSTIEDEEEIESETEEKEAAKSLDKDVSEGDVVQRMYSEWKQLISGLEDYVQPGCIAATNERNEQDAEYAKPAESIEEDVNGELVADKSISAIEDPSIQEGKNVLLVGEKLKKEYVKNMSSLRSVRARRQAEDDSSDDTYVDDQPPDIFSSFIDNVVLENKMIAQLIGIPKEDEIMEENRQSRSGPSDAGQRVFQFYQTASVDMSAVEGGDEEKQVTEVDPLLNVEVEYPNDILAPETGEQTLNEADPNEETTTNSSHTQIEARSNSARSNRRKNPTAATKSANLDVEGSKSSSNIKESRSIIEVVDEEPMSVLYSDGATPLFLAIEDCKWEEACEICHRDSKQAAVWVVSTASNTSDWRLWKRLPLHEVVRRQPPSWIVSIVIQAFPNALHASTDLGEIPLHVAMSTGAGADIINVLVMSNWEGLFRKNHYGKTPLDVWQAADDHQLSSREENAVNHALKYAVESHNSITSAAEKEKSLFRKHHQKRLHSLTKQHNNAYKVEVALRKELAAQLQTLQALVDKQSAEIQEHCTHRFEQRMILQDLQVKASTLNHDREEYKRMAEQRSRDIEKLDERIAEKNGNIEALREQVVGLQTSIQRLYAQQKYHVKAQMNSSAIKLQSTIDQFDNLAKTLTNYENEFDQILRDSLVQGDNWAGVEASTVYGDEGFRGDVYQGLEGGIWGADASTVGSDDGLEGSIGNAMEKRGKWDVEASTVCNEGHQDDVFKIAEGDWSVEASPIGCDEGEQGEFFKVAEGEKWDADASTVYSKEGLDGGMRTQNEYKGHLDALSPITTTTYMDLNLETDPMEETTGGFSFIPIVQEGGSDLFDVGHSNTERYQSRDDDGSEMKYDMTDSFERKDDASISNNTNTTPVASASRSVETRKLILPVISPKRASDRQQQMNSLAEIDTKSEQSKIDNFIRGASESFDAFEIR